jgi:cell division protein FtsQ
MTATAKSSHMDARIRARRARVRADAARRRQRRTLSLFILLLVVAAVAVALRSPLFGITGITVTGVSGGRAATVERAAALEQGQHLLTAPLAEAQARVEALPWVAEAVVHRSPPSTVVIEVTRRVPLLTLQTAEASWKVDDAAVLVDGGKVRKAPVITLGDADVPRLGQPIADRSVRDAVEVHTNLPPWLRRQVVAYEISPDHGLVLRLRVPPRDPEDGEVAPVLVRFGTARDLALKVEVIRVLLPQAAASGGALDVRAPANPVVVPSS